MNSLIDWKAFNRRTPNELDYRQEIASICLDELDRLLPELQSAIQQKSMLETSNTFHSIRSRCSHFCCEQIQQATAIGEEAANRGDWESVESIFPDLESLLVEFCVEIQSFAKRL